MLGLNHGKKTAKLTISFNWFIPDLSPTPGEFVTFVSTDPTWPSSPLLELPVCGVILAAFIPCRYEDNLLQSKHSNDLCPSAEMLLLNSLCAHTKLFYLLCTLSTAVEIIQTCQVFWQCKNARRVDVYVESQLMKTNSPGKNWDF